MEAYDMDMDGMEGAEACKGPPSWVCLELGIPKRPQKPVLEQPTAIGSWFPMLHIAPDVRKLV